jgi:hypothetical protein
MLQSLTLSANQPGRALSRRSVFLAAAAILVAMAAVWPLTLWFGAQIGETGLHGPIALIGAVPLVALIVAGSLTLAVIVVRRAMGVADTLVGLLPLGILFLATCVLIVIATNA